MALEPADDLQILFVRLLSRRADHFVSARIDPARLFHEDVLIAIDRVGEMNRAESGRGRQNDRIAQVDRFLVGVEPPEDAVFHVETFVSLFVKRFFRRFCRRFKRVGERVNLNVVADRHPLLQRSAPASAAADERDFDQIGSRREHASRDANSGDSARRFQDIASFHSFLTPQSSIPLFERRRRRRRLYMRKSRREPSGARRLSYLSASLELGTRHEVEITRPTSTRPEPGRIVRK